MYWIILFVIVAIVALFINAKILKKNPEPLPSTSMPSFKVEQPIFSLPRTSVTIALTQLKKYMAPWPFGSLVLYDEGLVAKVFKETRVSYKDIDHMELKGLILTLKFKTESPISILVQSFKVKSLAEALESKGITTK